MNTEKIETLAQIHAAQDIIIQALGDSTLTDDQIKDLQNASLVLRNMERSIVRESGHILTVSLTKDNQALKDLTTKIKRAAEKFEKVANAIEKAGKAVGVLINIIAAFIAPGQIMKSMVNLKYTPEEISVYQAECRTCGSPVYYYPIIIPMVLLGSKKATKKPGKRPKDCSCTGEKGGVKHTITYIFPDEFKRIDISTDNIIM